MNLLGHTPVIAFSFIALSAMSAVGCSSSETSAADEIVGPPTSESYIVNYTTEPSPAQVGENLLMLVITDKNEEPVLGATVEAEAWMSAHGHGTESPPTVMEMENGHYHVEDLVFQMPGEWTMDVTITMDGETESVSFELDVE